MAKTLLEMRSITKEFPGVKALSNVNLVVEEGEIHAICGENGAGKSTLMKVLSGIHPYGSYEGQIIYDGRECRHQTIKDSEKLGTVGGALIGALIMGVLNNAMSILGISQDAQQVVKGLVLLAAVAFDVISKQKVQIPLLSRIGHKK